MKLNSGLYIVSTPIGNLDDITIRALEVLKHSDIICCEDTRTTQKLLQKHNIKAKKLFIYNDHADENVRRNILSFLESGQIISIVSDAGTPLISDPGYKLVREVQNRGIYIDVIPGPCALISGLVLSGLPTDKFIFLGFLPKSEEAKTKCLKKYENIDSTIIFYESANRAKDTLNSILNILGNREVAISREITKIFQQTVRKPVKNLIEEDEITYKGEFVILISPEKEVKEITLDEIENRILSMMKQGLSKKDIASQISIDSCKKFKKNEIYKICDKIEIITCPRIN